MFFETKNIVILRYPYNPDSLNVTVKLYLDDIPTGSYVTKESRGTLVEIY